jgi:hypothetical protein
MEEGSNRSGKQISAALSELMKTLPSLGWLADAVEQRDSKAVEPPILAAGDTAQVTEHTSPMGFMAASSHRVVPVDWPVFFEPRHLSCGARADQPMVVALATRGFGALMKLDVTNGGATVSETRPFALEGLNELGPLAGTSWGNEGLHLVTKSGRVLRCDGHGPNDQGTWPCGASGAVQLPISQGSRVAAAAVTELDAGSGRRMAAIIIDEFPDEVVLFGERSEGGWEPAGEIHLPPRSFNGGAFQSSGLAFDGAELLAVSAITGEVHRRHALPQSSAAALVARTHKSPSMGAGSSGTMREWHSVCALKSPVSKGGLLRLSLQHSQTEAGSAAIPELIAALQL